MEVPHLNIGLKKCFPINDDYVVLGSKTCSATLRNNTFNNNATGIINGFTRHLGGLRSLLSRRNTLDGLTPERAIELRDGLWQGNMPTRGGVPRSLGRELASPASGLIGAAGLGLGNGLGGARGILQQYRMRQIGLNENRMRPLQSSRHFAQQYLQQPVTA